MRILASLIAFVAFAALGACAVPEEQDDPDVVPPVEGRSEIEEWFRGDHYQRWSCEPLAHAAFAPSPHGIVRLCANPIIAADADGARPLDSAMVIEIRTAGGVLVGRGAQRKTSEGPTGDHWYWYMTVPADSATPHDDTGLAANGWGQEGPAHDVCVACHAQAGTPDHPGHDFVWNVP